METQPNAASQDALSNDIFALPPRFVTSIPQHGYLTSNTGIRHLRFPILRIFRPEGPVEDRWERHRLHPFDATRTIVYRTLRGLAIALREIDAEYSKIQLIATIEPYEMPPSERSADLLTEDLERREKIEILLLSAFVLLRRLADDTFYAIRPVLFEHPASAPSKYATALDCFRKGTIARAKPYCNIEELENLFDRHVSWIDVLRKDGGIRDTLVHRPHRLVVSWRGHGIGKVTSWTVSANLIQEDQGRFEQRDLLPVLRECVAEACTFLTALARMVAPSLLGYTRHDLQVLMGDDSHVISFWPAIEQPA